MNEWHQLLRTPPSSKQPQRFDLTSHTDYSVQSKLNTDTDLTPQRCSSHFFIMADDMEQAQAQAQIDGVNSLRNMIVQGQRQQEGFRNNIANPLQNFSTEELRLMNGPQPIYTNEDRAADEDYNNYVCPISHTVPAPSNIVRWRGHYYSRSALESFREETHSDSEPMDPMTREVLSWPDFLGGDVPLDEQEQELLMVLGQNWNERTARRDLRIQYDSLRRRLADLQRVRAAQERARQAGLPVGQAPTVEQQVTQVVRDSPVDVMMMGVEVQENNRRRNRNRNGNGTIAAVAANPLAANADTRIAFPSNMWENRQIQDAVTNFLLMCEQAGFENTIGRGQRTSYVNANVASFFNPNGSFSGLVQPSFHVCIVALLHCCSYIGLFLSYRPLNAQTFGRRLSALDRHFNNLLTNHSNADGAQGEELPSWFNVRQRMAIWQDSQGTRGRQAANRAQNRDIQVVLGTQQLPLGPGNPQVRREVAAENPQQVRGPQEIGAGLTIRNVTEGLTDTGNAAPDTGNTGTRRRRVRSPVPGGTGNGRRNRPRSEAENIQDHINGTRNHIDRLADSIGNIAQSAFPDRRNMIQHDPVEAIQRLYTNVTAIATQLSPAHLEQAHLLGFHATQGLMCQAAESHGISLPPPLAFHDDNAPDPPGAMDP